MNPTITDYTLLLGKKQIDRLKDTFHRYDHKKGGEIKTTSLNEALEEASGKKYADKHIQKYLRESMIKGNYLTFNDFIHAYVKLHLVDDNIKGSEGVEIVENIKQEEQRRINKSYPSWWPARVSAPHLKTPAPAIVETIGEGRVDKLRSVYRRADIDNDDLINIETLHGILTSLGRDTTVEGLQRFLHRLDMCHDGLISFAEFIHAIAAGVGTEVCIYDIYVYNSI